MIAVGVEYGRLQHRASYAAPLVVIRNDPLELVPVARTALAVDETTEVQTATIQSTVQRPVAWVRITIHAEEARPVSPGAPPEAVRKDRPGYRLNVVHVAIRQMAVERDPNGCDFEIVLSGSSFRKGNEERSEFLAQGGPRLGRRARPHAMDRLDSLMTIGVPPARLQLLVFIVPVVLAVQVSVLAQADVLKARHSYDSSDHLAGTRAIDLAHSRRCGPEESALPDALEPRQYLIAVRDFGARRQQDVGPDFNIHCRQRPEMVNDYKVVIRARADQSLPHFG